MKIYRYSPNSTEYQKILNDNSLKSKQKDNALNDAIQTLGTEVTLQEYFNDTKRNFYFKDYNYQCFGDAKNIIERLAYGEIKYDNDLSYCNIKENFPEDLIESRTDWNDMKDYADGLYYFIKSLKSEIACGNIIFNTENE